MTEKIKRFRVWALVASCCLLALGILMMLYPGVSALTVCCFLGALCICIGVYELSRYFSLGIAGVFFRFDLALGLTSILAGLLLLLHPAGAMTILPIAAGLYIIIDSVFGIQLSMELRRLGLRSWWLSMILGAFGALFGFLLVLDPFDGASALMVFLGVSLTISGAEGICTILSISHAARMEKQDIIG